MSNYLNKFLECYGKRTDNTDNEYGLKELSVLSVQKSGILEKNNLSIEIVKEAAAEDWDEIQSNPEMFDAFADAVSSTQLMQQGIVPENFTGRINCKGCGLVPVDPSLVGSGSILGCPWCWNRAYGYPLPKLEDSNEE